MPLRCVVSLPRNVHRLSLLVEFGIINLPLLHDALAVCTANRLLSGNDLKPTTVLFLSQTAAPSRVTIAKSHRKFGQTITLAEHRLKIKHTSATASSLRELKLHALALQRQSLLAQDAGKFYKRLVPPDGAAS